MAARIQFDPALSQRMYAGADLFLMPSLFEPCGLSQMIAMRYGTLPIVRETGGLKDTVIPYNCYTGEGTGFSFAHFNGDEMADAVFRAARLFWDDRAAFNGLVENAMKADFSWKRSADAYIALYHNLHPEIPMPQPKPEPEPTPETPVEAAAEDAVPVEEPKAEEKPVEKPEAKAEIAPSPSPSRQTHSPFPRMSRPPRRRPRRRPLPRRPLRRRRSRRPKPKPRPRRLLLPPRRPRQRRLPPRPQP